MKKSNLSIYLIILISIVLCVPSIIYLVINKTVDGFNSYYTYNLFKYNGEIVGNIEGILIISLLILLGVLYLYIIRNEKEVFKNIRQVVLLIVIISFIFMLILPFLSSDIYYYIGDSWITAKYKGNPYYTTVKDLQDNGINDEILQNTGTWKHTTSIYGPIWNMIATCLSFLSFGNITLALFIYKFAALLIHFLNCYFIYKITKNIKAVLLYGLNPLVLLEFLSNVHNDIYLILFMLIAIYFLKKHKNIYLTILFLTLSICIKYSTILVVPFILIYYFRKKTIPKRFAYCIISGFAIILLTVIFYMPYFRDFSIFTNMLVQGNKYSQSILLLVKQYLTKEVFLSIDKILIPLFGIIYLTILITIIFKKRILISEIFKKYNWLMLVFIFVILATFQKWYILWLIPTIYWQKKSVRNWIIYATIVALVPSALYFETGGDSWFIGKSYSFTIIVISTVLTVIKNLISNYRKRSVIKQTK